MKRNPNERLGAGSQGSENDYQKLKNHPFFKDIDFKGLINQNPPLENVDTIFKKKSYHEEADDFELSYFKK